MAASDNYMDDGTNQTDPAKVTYPSQNTVPTGGNGQVVTYGANGQVTSSGNAPVQGNGTNFAGAAPAPTAPAPAAGAAINWTPGSGVPQGLPAGDYQSWVNTAYQGSQGRAPTADEMSTWTNYWNQWGSKDPTYFQQRLFQPENYQSGGSPSGGGASGSGQPSAPYVPGQGVAGMGTVFGAGGATGTQAGNDYYAQLMGISNLPRDISPDDPVIKNQVNAYSAQNDRADQNALAANAERGGTYGSNDATARSLAEANGQNTGAYQAQLINTATQQRVQQITQALQMQGSALSDAERNQLQEELSQLQLGQGAYQFDTNMDYLNSPLVGS